MLISAGKNTKIPFVERQTIAHLNDRSCQASFPLLPPPLLISSAVREESVPTVVSVALSLPRCTLCNSMGGAKPLFRQVGTEMLQGVCIGFAVVCRVCPTSLRPSPSPSLSLIRFLAMFRRG